jgi:hypothetical protein
MVNLLMTNYKELVGDKLKETEGRSTYTATEVRDILLDLWLAITADEAETAAL